MLGLLRALLIVPSLGQAPQQPDTLARERVVGPIGAQIDSQLTRFASYGLSGTVLVVKQGGIVLLKGYGLADVERGVLNGAATRFEMNSMTKMFTGVAILQLAAQGRLRVSDPVAKYLPGFPPAKSGATIEQLASHTAGLVVAGTALAGGSRAAFVRDVATAPVESPPGAQYRYSNAGFSLLAAIIEQVSGETYEAYLRRHVFSPAGMTTAVFRPDVPSANAAFAHGYVGTPAALEPGPPNPYIWGTVGSGGVWSTVGDVYRYVVSLKARRVLPETLWRVLTAHHRPPAEEAFGWHVDTAADGRARFQKGGGSDDFASHMLYYPNDDVVVVWASNNLRVRWRSTLNRAIPEVLFAGKPIVLPPVARQTRAALTSLAGGYLVGRDSIDVLVGEGFLYVAANTLGVPTNVMFFPQSDSHFTAFDPAIQAITTLERGATPDRSMTFVLADGRRILARRR